MLIGRTNHFDATATTLTADAEAADLGVTNLQIRQLGSILRIPAASGYVEWDLGSSKSFKAFSLQGTNLTSAATFRLRLSDTATTTGDILDTGAAGDAQVDDDYGAFYHVLTTALSAQYGRLDIADATLANMDFGRLWGGPMSAPTYDHRHGGENAPLDYSKVGVTEAGQTVVRTGVKARVLSFTMDMTDAEAFTIARDLDRNAGLSGDVLVMLEPTGSYVSETSALGIVTQASPITTRSFDLRMKSYRVREHASPFQT